MEYHLTIKGRLPGMNELIAANRTNKFKGAKIKRDAQTLVGYSIKQQLKKIHIILPVQIEYEYYEPRKNRDLDNISGFAHKVIQDSLVECGVLQNDGWANIIGFMDSFYVDNKNPRIEITIREVLKNDTE